MQLTKLILKNFRSHKNLTLNFNEGVTAILGGNGSGKSSVVEAIMVLLTGEGYSKTKQDMITVGEVSGHVIGHWIINSKEAVLERHLDSSKVLFKYDGITYKKSSEVNEIWDKLFQIDKHIVQNVIISNQGEIAMLFNGDQASKEKLFQKIFMVPNTTKIRDTVWNNYIKTSPPEYPVKNQMELDSDVQCVEKLVELAQEQIDQINLDQDQYHKMVVRADFLETCKESLGKTRKWQTSLEELLSRISALEEKQKKIRNKLSSVDSDQLKEMITVCELDKTRYATKQEYSRKLEEAQNYKPSVEKPNQEQAELRKQRLSDLRAELKSNNTKLKELEAKLAEYKNSGLSSGVCPTCGTQVDSVIKLIEHVEREILPINNTHDNLLAEGAELKAIVDADALALQSWENYQKEVDRLKQGLLEYQDVEYDKENHESMLTILEHVRKLEKEMSSNADLLVSLVRDQTALQMNLASVVSYDGTEEEYQKEVSHVAGEIVRYKEGLAELRKHEQELAAKKQELKSLVKERDDNLDYARKNQQRKEYVEVLDKVYDLFHPSKFPRLLIQTYAGTVSEYMNEVLEAFDFPYTASVNESFGIDVYNEDGHKLPSVSGGQQVMIGFSLRLALHNMFVGAFPFMIVDEGSYGLNGENTKKYFEVISKLNKSSKFKQVIVIDHHEELSEYVDNTINL